MLIIGCIKKINMLCVAFWRRGSFSGHIYVTMNSEQLIRSKSSSQVGYLKAECAITLWHNASSWRHCQKKKRLSMLAATIEEHVCVRATWKGCMTTFEGLIWERVGLEEVAVCGNVCVKMTFQHNQCVNSFVSFSGIYLRIIKTTISKSETMCTSLTGDQCSSHFKIQKPIEFEHRIFIYCN